MAEESLEKYHDAIQSWWQWFNASCQKHQVIVPLGDRWQPLAPRVWLGSEFVRQWCCECPADFASLVATGSLFRSFSKSDYYFQYREVLKNVRSVKQLKHHAKQFRRQMLVRIIWRDIAGWADLHATLQETSWCADAIIDLTNKLLHRWQSKRETSVPTYQGRPSHLMVVAVGKLGGMALNISSDVDLIFCYMADAMRRSGDRSLQDSVHDLFGGDPDGRDDAHAFYTQLARTLIDVLHQPMESGCVYRVDMRLRPFGASGDLVIRADQLLKYYQSDAREWERYAMLKARCVSGDPRATKSLLALIMDFVYRPYLDYATIESLRHLHAMWRAESYKRQMQNNIKKGAGGIRELEFIVQHIQLMRGGQEPRLRQNHWLLALHHIGQERLLPDGTVDDLEGAYLFFRHVENRFQAYQDMQTHVLPLEHDKQERIALALQWSSGEALQKAIAHWRGVVHQHFKQLVLVVDESMIFHDQRLLKLVGRYFSARSDADLLKRALVKMGFDAIDDLMGALSDLRQQASFKALQGKRLQDFLGLVVVALLKAIDYAPPTRTMCAMLSILSVVLKRHAYLILLSEHADTLERLVRMCHAGVWLVNQIVSYPVLLGELIDERRLHESLGLQAMRQQLRHWLQASSGADEAEYMRVVQHFKKTHLFRIAAMDVGGKLPIAEVSNRLSYLAEAILHHVQRLAWRAMLQQYGRPPGAKRSPRFLIVAYGKLGGVELGYGSDLDLIFLYQPGSEGGSGMTDGPEPISESVFYTRLAQKILHCMAHQTLMGPLYTVDVRLRPMGDSGLLVNSLASFRVYQLEQAWSWEHQALVRARAVVGPAELRSSFYAVRKEVLSMKRSRDALWQSVAEMRDKLSKVNQHVPKGLVDLKRGQGCVTDIEFIVQYVVLLCAASHPSLMHYSDNLRLLGVMGRLGVFTLDESRCMQAAYLAYRSAMHQLDLQSIPSHTVSARKFRALREAVQRVWKKCARVRA